MTGMVALVGLAAPAGAAEGSIDHVASGSDVIKILYSLPGEAKGARTVLGSLSVTLDGEPVDASATLATDSQGTVRRTVILAIDASKSMGGTKITEAKRAADVFIASVPADVYVGIVTFAGDVRLAQKPTLDRAALKSVVDALKLSQGTDLYQGVGAAIRAAGANGQRNVLVLSDGRDTSGNPVTDITDAIGESDVRVDVIALAQSAPNQALLRTMVDAGAGRVLSAGDPAALSGVIASEAETLATQLLITVTPPKDLGGTEGTLAVSIDADGQNYTDSAYVTLDNAGKASSTTAAPTRLAPAPTSGLSIPKPVMLLALVAAGGSLLLLLAIAFGLFDKKRETPAEDRISTYLRSGSRKADPVASLIASPPTPRGVKQQALGMAEKALTGNKGIEAALAKRLDGGGMSLKPAEWLLMHVGIAFAAALVGLLLGSGSLLFAVLFLLLGAVAPYLFLGLKRSRRLNAFNSQLADTLQLMAGSLSAGLSLAQSVDTVVREGSDPLGAEFRRALVEVRLGVAIEDALGSVAERMESKDFEWVVMAVRIQRDVGGNLAELLSKVAETMRERDYLRRQVKTLSAEGKLSGYILGGLPPVFLVYLFVVQRSYLEPMLHSPLGWFLFGLEAVLMAVGAFWMSKTVKVEV